MVHGKNRIPYWIDRRLNGLAGPEYHATISFGLPFEPEDSQYGESRTRRVLYDCKRISYRIDRRLSGLAGPDYDATISFGLPFEPEDSQYGKYRLDIMAIYVLYQTLETEE